MNEAFAAQVLANLQAFEKDPALGAIDPEILNLNGGAIALGHPVGASATRLVLTLLMEMRRRKVSHGLATLCIGGGQGARSSWRERRDERDDAGNAFRLAVEPDGLAVLTFDLPGREGEQVLDAGHGRARGASSTGSRSGATSRRSSSSRASPTSSSRGPT